MHRRTPIKNRAVDPPARFNEASWVEVGNGSDSDKKESLVPKKKYPKPKSIQQSSLRPILRMMKNKLASITNDFCHARTGVQGCFVAGVVRCLYAILYLYSLILLTIQMPTLLDPHKGLLPYFITSESLGDWDYSIFEFAPQSSLLLYFMFFLGLASGVLLLLGIEARKAAIGVYFFLYNLQFHNNEVLFDHEIRMSKMWAFFLILLPLDHFTVYDDFGGLATAPRKRLHLPPKQQAWKSKSTSWPMWPFRLWQMYTCMVAMGEGFSKLNSQEWRSGNALSWLWYDETLGRLYPAFVVELLYNRLICIKLQTWMYLLIGNLCFITIWPLKFRKQTFVAIALMHIGNELATVMHVFEYLSVLGWICFFVYPDEGISKLEVLIKNKKNVGEKWTAENRFRSMNKVKTIEIAVAASLLYLLIYDIFPCEETELLLMPSTLAFLANLFVYPSQFVSSKLFAVNHLIGISSEPYTISEGAPWHAQSRMTAVIRFSDGEEPILYQDADWATSSFFRREIDYWYSEYKDHLYEDLGDTNSVPYYAALSVYLAETYGKGSIDRHYNQVTVLPDNEIESISIQVHRRQGSDLPAPLDWSLFASIPREWSYKSVCQYVFTPQVVQLEDQKFTFPINQLWDRSEEDGSRHVINGCINYNPADDFYHRQGKYGDFDDPAEITVYGNDNNEDDGTDGNAGPNDDDSEDELTAAIVEEDEEDEENPNEDVGDDTPPENVEADEDEEENPIEESGEEENPNKGEEEEDGEDEEDSLANEGGYKGQDGSPFDEHEDKDEDDNPRAGDDGGIFPGGDVDEGEGGEEEGNEALNGEGYFEKLENDGEEGAEDNEDGVEDDDRGSDDELRQNHRRLRARSDNRNFF